jgi:hydroxyacylglutathione hydrolase
VGIDRLEGYFPDMEEWKEAGRSVRELTQLSPEELFRNRESYEIIDVRGDDEWQEERIRGAKHIHVGSLKERQKELPREGKLLLHCASGSRSTLGASILESLGFEDVTNLDGGIEAWQEAGLPVERG